VLINSGQTRFFSFFSLSSNAGSQAGDSLVFFSSSYAGSGIILQQNLNEGV
jgi:hypothetical protein